jgi:hypothetical protein
LGEQQDGEGGAEIVEQRADEEEGVRGEALGISCQWPVVSCQGVGVGVGWHGCQDRWSCWGVEW